MDVAEILSALDIDDHSRVEWRRIGIVPEKKLLTIALEGDFDEMRQTLLLPRAQTQEFLPAASHEFLGTHLPQLFDVTAEHRLQRFGCRFVIGVGATFW